MEKRVITSINLFLVFNMIICLILGGLGLYKQIDNKNINEYNQINDDNEYEEEPTLEKTYEEEANIELTE